ncbi:MAG: ATP-binding cassette domain-containing protein [Anaerolineae bacterium]
MNAREPLVNMVNISKKFGEVQALAGVSLSVYRDEVVGLVGDNGAGKSTLIKVLTGLYPPDEGEIYFEGKRVHFSSPREARDAGIETVYQGLGLVDLMSISRNFFLGRELTREVGFLRFLDLKRIGEECGKVLQEIGIRRERSPDTVTAVLSGGERQSINIGRAMYFKAKLVILDEPTTALSVKETEMVLEFIERLKKSQVPVIFITHNIYHVYQVADKFTILERGVKVGDFNKKDVKPEDVIEVIRLGKITERMEGDRMLDRAIPGSQN